VGKTLTAEGISEFLERPLYMVGAGELGTDSRTLETQLSRILDIAHVWGAVLLLDEADVFLERRSVHDLQRNALVSIFLRLLEYFQGILFLTTNRVETFDEAFQSRIHIALRYNDLDRKAKKVIWKTFLGMVSREECQPGEPLRDVVNGEELEGLAKRQLNGRQVCAVHLKTSCMYWMRILVSLLGLFIRLIDLCSDPCLLLSLFQTDKECSSYRTGTCIKQKRTLVNRAS
jgi:SpoVK/Ycf46/Vps4 family AAA+-type ATPase